MDERVVIVKDAFTEDFCDELLAEGRSYQKAEIGNLSIGTVNSEKRRSEVSWIKSIVDTPHLFFPILQKVKEVNEEVYGFDLYNLESMQLTKYCESDNGFFHPHIDDPTTKSSSPYQRKLSLSLFLSSPSEYEGGDFVVFDTEYSPKEVERLKNLSKGTAVFFPSYVMHGVEPVTKGLRQTLVAWIIGPRFK